jgi:uncharacterized protein HemY
VEAQYQQGSYVQVVEHCKKWLTAHKNSMWAYSTMGMANLKQQEFGQANNCFQKAIKIAENCDEVPSKMFMDMGDAYYEMGNPEMTQVCYTIDRDKAKYWKYDKN